MSTTLRLPPSPRGVRAVAHYDRHGWCAMADGTAVGVDVDTEGLPWLFAESDAVGATLVAVLHTDVVPPRSGKALSDSLAAGQAVPMTVYGRVPHVAPTTGWRLRAGAALVDVDAQLFELTPGEGETVTWSPRHRPAVLGCSALVLELGTLKVEVLATSDPDQLAYRVRDTVFVGVALDAARTTIARLTERPMCVLGARGSSGIVPAFRGTTQVGPSGGARRVRQRRTTTLS
jgi:hypothetical protein